jgi:hypothetical protein
MNDAVETVKTLAPKIYSRELVEVIYSQPFTRIAFLETAGLAKRQTASMYLKRLVCLGLLEPVKVWRETLYLNRRLLDLLAA